MKVYTDLNQICTLEGVHQKDGRRLAPKDLSIISNASVVFDKEKIIWVGSSLDLPARFDSIEKTSLKGHVLTPQIVDSHTHLVFGGNRSFEYTLRLNGADYEEIAKNGGGILSTMKSTCESSEEELFTNACNRIEKIISYGVGAIEIKSGYALTYEKEKLISEVIHKLKKNFEGRVTIHNTYLAAHAVPSIYENSSDYINKVVIPLLKDLAPLNIIDSVDIFHEKGYFSKDDVFGLFDLCKALGIARRIHADEFHDNEGASIAVDYECLSCDHLLKTSAYGIAKLANSNTVATILPGTALFLGKPFANARSFLDAGCKVAIASDYNPGSCHFDNVLMIASQTAKVLGLNISELWAAITYNSSHALNLKNQGVIKEGFDAKFSIFKCNSLDEITYNWGKNLAVLL